MATLSKVLPDVEGAVEPVTWRTNGAPGGAAPGPRVPRPAPVAARPAPEANAELEAQVHQQLQLAFESGVREGDTAARQKLEGEVRQAVERLAAVATEVAASRGE